MEEFMPALTDRQKARERLEKLLRSNLDKMIPLDESVPLNGGQFVDWEDMADQLERALIPAFLEERAALEAGAQVESGGRCPHCGSDRVYLSKQTSKVELLTPHGPVVMEKQRCRCRSCDRSFSPSGAGLEPAGGSGVVAEGGGAGGPRGGDAVVRQRRPRDQHRLGHQP